MRSFRFMLFFSCLALLSLVAAQPAAAEKGRLSLSPFVGGYFFEGDRYQDDAPIGGLALGYRIFDSWTAEASYGYTNPHSQQGRGDTDGHLMRLEALYSLGEYSGFEPFLAAGAGYLTMDSEKGYRNMGLLGYGAGLRYFITESFALRGDIRHLIADPDEPRNHLLTTAGVSWFIGGDDTPESKPVDVYKAIEESKPQEAAQQEVVQTEEIVVVEESESTVVEEMAPAEKAYIQKPATKPEPVVTCAEIDVKFDFDRTTIKPEFDGQLQQFADFLKANPDTDTVTINGHTDNIGPKAYNMGLSMRRAKSVEAYLIKRFGLKSSRFHAKGFGFDDPMAPNDSRAGRAKNRRATSGVCVEK